MSLTNVDAPLIVEKKAGVAWLKLNRPKVMNCLNRELLQAIVDACKSLSQDRQTRVVGVIGSGAKTFCAGADLAERKTMSQNDTLDYIALINLAFRSLELLPQPVIAAVNGSCYGGGTELALACDLRVMVKGCAMRLTEVKLGIIPGAGGTQRLPRLIGKSLAKELILTGAPLTAERAYEIGLVHRLVQAEESASGDYNQALIDFVETWAAEIAEAGPLALKAAKEAIDGGFDQSLEAAMAIETRAYLRLVTTKDRLEGLAAFAEKRKPIYTGE